MSATQKKLQPTLSMKDFDPEQLAAVEHACARPWSLQVLPTGFGKSVVSLTAARQQLQAGKVTRVLVIAPLKVCKLTWATEHLKWDHLKDLDVALAIGSPAKRVAAIMSCAEIVVLNVDNVGWFFKTYGGDDIFDGLIIDELTKFKDVGGVGYKAIRNKAKHFKWRVGLTATPVEEALTDLYGEIMLLDDGKTFGRNKEAFLLKYFYPTDWERRNWAPKDGTPELLVQVLVPNTFFVDRGEYEEGLPDLHVEYIMLEMPSELTRKYKELASCSVLGDVSADNAAVLSGKLQQLANGFLYDENGVADWHDSYKLDEIITMLDETGELGQPTIFVYTFTAQLERLQAALPNLRVLSGSADEDVMAGWNEGRIRHIALHPKSAAHGLNLQYGGNQLVMLSPIWSADAWHQVVGRLHRRGSPYGEINVLVCVADGSVENLMLDRVADKREQASVFAQYMMDIKKPA